MSNLERSIDFYGGGLGFEVARPAEDAPAHSARMQLADAWIDLVEIDDPGLAAMTSATASDPRFQHAAIVAADMSAAWNRLQVFAPAAITRSGPQRLPARAGGVTAYKFRDPDGHPLELIHFPRGTGDARWHQPPHAEPTLGIDHFALAVADVERSIAFLAGLGFAVTSRQINRGVAQARLDGLAEPVVEIVALSAAARPTPHLELLSYRQPASPHPGPARETPPRHGDIVCLAVDVPAREGTLIDPDGHALRLSRH